MGLSIGADTLARLLRDQSGRWSEEAEALHQAGLASGAWVATDQTSTRVDGQNEPGRRAAQAPGANLAVGADLTGKREHIYHAAMRDPYTAAELDLDQIWALVDDLIAAHGDWLPAYT